MRIRKLKVWLFPKHEWDEGEIKNTHRRSFIQYRCKVDYCYAKKRLKLTPLSTN